MCSEEALEEIEALIAILEEKSFWFHSKVNIYYQTELSDYFVI